MSKFFPTYVLNSDETLHNHSKRTGVNLPCNETMFQVKLVRGNEFVKPEFSEWPLARPEKTLNGEAFMLLAKVNFSRDYSASDPRSRNKVVAKTKEEALKLFLSKSGLEKAGVCSVEAVRDISVHGHVEVNTFVITGVFKVKSQDLFVDAYNNGIGKRKSYGCGLIVVI